MLYIRTNTFFKKMKQKYFLLIALLFSGCTRELIGEVGGGSLGALIGSQIGRGKGTIVSTAVGTLLGAKLGGYIGKQFDESEKKDIESNVRQSIEQNREVDFKVNGNHFHVMPSSSNSNSVRILVEKEGQRGNFSEFWANKRADGSLEICPS